MKHPFWIVNSALSALFLLIVALIFIGTPRTPHLANFIPTQEIKFPTRDIVKIDTNKIYVNDLFDTYKPSVAPIEEKYKPKAMPQPPAPRLLKAPFKAVPKFLEPLKINLKGVIVGSDEELNRAIIENAQEKTAKNYKIGDRIGDARLIRIFKNKIILLRSNGQQETIYINSHDAELEAMLLPDADWASVIKKIGPQRFEIDPDIFLEKVPTLAQLIEILDLTTVYQKGKSIGCRIGKIGKTSLANALGLMRGDIITKINNIPTTTTKNRFDIYRSIINLDIDNTITIEFKRKNQALSYSYILKKFELPKDIHKSPENTQKLSLGTIEQRELTNYFQQQNKKYKAITQRIEKKEKEGMLKLNNHPLSAHKRRAQGALMNNINL